MRLIDADKLIEDFKTELLKVDYEKLSDNDKLIISTSAIALRDFVKRQPTAYDIDKIVEELESLVKVIYVDTKGNTHLRYSMETILKAIEIVKAGGKE